MRERIRELQGIGYTSTAVRIFTKRFIKVIGSAGMSGIRCYIQ
jgi:hypothetical protein